jgi:Ca2+-binding RTX toxin-like protein
MTVQTHRIAWLTATFVALVLAGSALAGSTYADTYCVWKTAASECPSSGTSNTSDLQDALTQAQASATTDDTVEVRAGEFTSDTAGYSYSGGPTNRVTITGAGRTHTTVTAPDGLVSNTVLTLDHADVSGVRVVVPKASSKRGIDLGDGASADDIAVQAAPGASGTKGVVMSGTSTLTGAHIKLRFGGEADGVEMTGGTGASIDRSTIEATFPVLFAGASSPLVERSHLIGALGVGASKTGGSGGEVRDTVIEADGGIALDAAPSGSDVATIIATNVTAVNTGRFGGSIGALSDATAGFPEVDFFDSVELGFETSGKKIPGPHVATLQGQHYASDAPINGDFAGGPSGTPDVDHGFGFVDAQGGDYHLRADSPLIDHGNQPFPGITDFDGNPRYVDGDGSPSNSELDIGAYEFQPHPPAVRASAAPGLVQVGHAAAFHAVASDPDPGDTLTLAWKFDDGGTAGGANPAHAFGTPGTHRGTVTATDVAGRKASATAFVVVVAPKPPGPKPGVCVNKQTGTPGPDTLTGSRFGDVLIGLAGDDRLNGAGGDDCLRGGPGNDRLNGGRGKDVLTGGGGKDKLTGGSGKDRFSGGPGRDTIKSADGRDEKVNCGKGRDSVRADAGDHLVGCEKVKRVP